MLPYLKQSFKNLFKKPSTEAFPAGEPPKAAEGYRGRISYDPTVCINCGMCMRVCAPQCMTRTIKNLEGGDQEITLTFDLSSCTFCRMCADFCSRSAIKLTDDYMIVGTKPEDFIVSGTFIKKAPPKPQFTPEQIAAMKAKAEAAKAAKAAAAAKASGESPAAPVAPVTPAVTAAPTAPAAPAVTTAPAKPAEPAPAPQNENKTEEAKPTENE